MSQTPPWARTPRLTRFNLSNATWLKLDNFYDFRDWRDVIRYKTRLQDALLSTGSTRLPTVTLLRRKRPGPTPSAAS